MEATKKLTNLQLELLKTFKYELSDIQLKEIKNLLAQYFAQKATEEMDNLWDDNNWSNETTDEWLSEHMRTKYD